MPKKPITISPDDSAIKRYQSELITLKHQHGTTTEGNTRRAFGQMLNALSKFRNWTLIEEVSVKTVKGNTIRLDGVMRDEYALTYGYWEAKDEKDDLEREIVAKRDKGYPLTNIIFEDTHRAMLYQDGERAFIADLTKPDEIAQLLTRFFNHSVAPFEKFTDAVENFKHNVAQIGQSLKSKIEEAHRNKSNKKFQEAYLTFEEVCRQSLNPNISREAIDEMLIQHLLTEQTIKKVFGLEDFLKRNVIFNEVENVIDALTSQNFDRKDFLGRLEIFYQAIRGAADKLATFEEKQTFLNHVYEQFFQGYSVKTADTHGIVYTPNEIVDFMCASVQEVLKTEFNKDLGEEGVTVIDPCTGTGNFVVNLLNRVDVRYLDDFYKKRLFANEVMLMPYYIASLNIERLYFERTGQREPFEGICFVDTLDIAKDGRDAMLDVFFGNENTARVKRQREAEINVIIGNPPYNVGQVNENDNNKNRKYPVIDKAVRDTYAKDSKATLNRYLYDPYVKFFRWASDRLEGRDGVVCYVSNSGFVEGVAFDGMRKHLLKDFNRVYVLDLAGNARTSGERRRKEGGNVFNDLIRVGVSITIAVRNNQHSDHQLFYHRLGDYWTSQQKLDFLKQHVADDGNHNALNTIPWQQITPDSKNSWVISEQAIEFESFIPIGSKDAKRAKGFDNAESEFARKDDDDDLNVVHNTVFKTFSLGVATNRDEWVYNFNANKLQERMEDFIAIYNEEAKRYIKTKPANIDEFVRKDIKWTDRLKQALSSKNMLEFVQASNRHSIYRPFSKQYLYFDHLLNQRRYQQHKIFPTPQTETENRVICVSGIGSKKPFHTLISDVIPCLDILEKTQSFPFYTYDEDGTNRTENITDWALKAYQTHYDDATISKWDIFYYVYGVLHQPAYREKFADDLKKELPRIPYLDDFWGVSKIGKQLADLHLNYETGARYKLEWVTADQQLNTYLTDKMTPLKKKQVEFGEGKITVYSELKFNDTLTLKGIPEEAFYYRLGNRSALDWVVDQYKVKKDAHGEIISDPNAYSDDSQYIVKLIEQVVHVSVETVRLVGLL
jgi:predicted helicase